MASQQKERVELIVEHKNAGTTYPAGEELDVSPSTADWLYRNNIAKPATAKQSTPTFTEPEA
ncbi:hypothetical protein DLM_2086 [Aquitalea magnusonii]|uniref:DUF7210 domain-containing protein n=1 Tax=Aquitalea magnusonii TaxID=332411 RepID=A0A3G9GHG5_9NEIS|nr:hypothetical protein [Aquitalea magnusonii]BBF85701.1 hypothetical protein DLM_2086 [Aquitalea magnusonii]